MSDDGAQLGYDAKQALGAVLGGEQPAPEEAMSAEQMAAEIMALEGDPNTYEGTANWCAKLIVLWLQANPQRASEPTEMEYDWNGDPDRGSDGMKPEFVKSIGWYEQMKRDGVELADLDLTGFMWGWAVNAARRIVELPEVPNPAILNI